MTTPSTSTPEPTGEADVRLVDGYVQRLRSKANRGIAGAKPIIEAWKRIRSSLPTAPAAPARDEEMEAHARPIPEAARIKLEEAQSYFQPASKYAMALPLVDQTKVWDCIVMAKSFLGEPAAPSPVPEGQAHGLESMMAEAMDMLENWPMPKIGNPLREEMFADRKALRVAWRAYKAAKPTVPAAPLPGGADLREAAKRALGEMQILIAIVDIKRPEGDPIVADAQEAYDDLERALQVEEEGEPRQGGEPGTARVWRVLNHFAEGPCVFGPTLARDEEVWVQEIPAPRTQASPPAEAPEAVPGLKCPECGGDGEYRGGDACFVCEGTVPGTSDGAQAPEADGRGA